MRKETNFGPAWAALSALTEDLSVECRTTEDAEELRQVDNAITALRMHDQLVDALDNLIHYTHEGKFSSSWSVDIAETLVRQARKLKTLKKTTGTASV